MGKHKADDVDLTPSPDSEFTVDTPSSELLAGARYWRHIASVQLTDLQMTRRHLDYAHAAIYRARQELHALNAVIVRRKLVTRRLRMYVDAVKELHRPVDGRDLDNTTCREDGQAWPCRTHKAVETVAMQTLRRLFQNGQDHGD